LAKIIVTDMLRLLPAFATGICQILVDMRQPSSLIIKPMDKKAFRKKILTVRDNISEKDRAKKSLAIKKRLEKLEIFQDAYTVMFYVSFGSEVETHQLIKESFREKRVAVPLVWEKDLLVKQITDFGQLSPGAWTILEPEARQKSLGLSNINVMIVPGVTYDKNHHRMGYGGGYYDKLLARKDEGGFVSIGLAFEEQIVDDVPTETNDQKVDFIITDKKII